MVLRQLSLKVEAGKISLYILEVHHPQEKNSRTNNVSLASLSTGVLKLISRCDMQSSRTLLCSVLPLLFREVVSELVL